MNGENDFIPDVTNVLKSHGDDSENGHDLKLEFGHQEGDDNNDDEEGGRKNFN